MIEKELNIGSDFEDSDRIAREQDNQVTPQQRFEAFMKLMEPYYAVAEGLQRVCRIDDRRQRQVRDDWGIRIQPVPKSEGNG